MTEQTEGDHNAGVEALDATAVAEYLRRHPDFLARRPKLLASLEIPHTESGGASSLIERQVEVLRSQNAALQAQLDELLDIGRENDELIRRIHALVLELIDAPDAHTALELLRHSLVEDFGADEAVVRLLAAYAEDAPEAVSADDPAWQAISEAAQQGSALCGRLSRDQATLLFPVPARAASAVVIPLTAPELIGWIAVGSHDEARFRTSMDTGFLSFLGSAAGRILSTRLT